MSEAALPALDLESWKPTYETLHQYVRGLTAIRRAMTPHQKHWGHVSFVVNATGLTTTPIPAPGCAFEVALDLTAHQAVLWTSRGAKARWRLRGQSPAQFWDEVHAALGAAGIQTTAEMPAPPEYVSAYDVAAVERYWTVLSRLDLLLKQFRGELRAETSAVQFWSHDFDLAMLWFSGRLVPGKDPADERNADEQMNFGFTVGDARIPEPYFYVTAYPNPEGWVGAPLPDGAEWHTEGWNGVVLKYKALASKPAPDNFLLEFWRKTQQRGAELMRD